MIYLLGLIIHILAGLAGIALFCFVITDAFQTMVIPRSANSSLRITVFFYRAFWGAWRAAARRMSGNRRETHLWTFGPLSLIMLLIVWAWLLMFSFAFVQYGLGSRVHAPEAHPGFWTDLYMSGATLFTLGYGDVAPIGRLSRLVSITEAGVGFGFLAIVIGYLPVLYQSFSRREVVISMLDARAGSPPSACELIRRHDGDSGLNSLSMLLAEWERWAADVLESHLSYPVLMFYRSQHDRQSWLGSLTAILDTCALAIAGGRGEASRQARLTFAMGRHALIDLTLILNVPPVVPDPDRLPPEGYAVLRKLLAAESLHVGEDHEIDELTKLRKMYEPYAQALSDFLFVDLPPWYIEGEVLDNWEASAWEKHGSTRDADFVLHPSVDTSKRS